MWRRTAQLGHTESGLPGMSVARKKQHQINQNWYGVLQVVYRDLPCQRQILTQQRLNDRIVLVGGVVNVVSGADQGSFCGVRGLYASCSWLKCGDDVM